MGDIRDLAEKLWTGEITTRDHHPVAGRLPEAEEIADGLLTFIGTASANTLDTGDGLVMLDTGGHVESQRIHQQVRAWRPDAPLRAAVFSHHHIDHIFGVGPFDEEAQANGWPRPLAYGHEAIPANFRRYEKTLPWNTAINLRQFAFPADRFSWPSGYRYPDVTYRDRITFRHGDLTFELNHCRGETEDATWTWVPEKKILHPGDLFIWAVPNAGNPQKVQRYVGEWATGLRQMAALGAEIMIAGHGLPIFGADRIQQALTDTAEFLESIESQTLALMNEGAPLDRCLHEVEIPAHLLEKPWLRPVYDHPQFIIRNVWRLYGGWYDGEPDNLLPAPRAEQAAIWVELAGGLDAVLGRAAELRDAGNLPIACHLVEYAVLADPTSTPAHQLRAEIYGLRASQQESSMARNILNHAALASQQGKRDLAGNYGD